MHTAILFAVAVFVIAGCSSETDTSQAARDNLVQAFDAPQRIIVFTVDSLRSDHLHGHGYERETSPNIDALAERSADFAWAVAPSHVTRRSVASYFSGRFYSDMHHDPSNQTLPEWPETLAEFLQSKGFRTTAWTMNQTLRKGAGFEQGFDAWHALYPVSKVKADLPEFVEHVKANYTPSGGREFIYIHTSDVHRPYRPPIPYDTMFVERPYGRTVVREGNMFDRKGGFVLSNLRHLGEINDVTQEDIDFLVSLYDGTIRYTDALLDRVFEAFQFDPAKDMFILMADHGEQFFEHGYWGHAKQMYPEEIRVPLIVHYDGITPGRRENPVSLLDLYPTIAEMYGFEAPEGLRGESILATLLGGAEPERPVYSEPLEPRGPAGVVIHQDRYYSLHTRAATLYPWELWPYREEFYDLASDPLCQTNRIDDASNDAAKFNTLLRATNGRFVQFDTESIARSEEDVRYGENLLGDSLAALSRRHLGAVSIEQGEGLTLAFAAAEPAQEFALPPLDRRAPYLVRAEFTNEEGVLFFHLRNAERRENDWVYEQYTPTQGPRVLEIVVYAEDPDAAFVVGLRGSGRASISNLEFRRVYYPNLEVVPLIDDTGEVQEPPPLSEAEIENLESLGYAGEK